MYMYMLYVVHVLYNRASLSQRKIIVWCPTNLVLFIEVSCVLIRSTRTTATHMCMHVQYVYIMYVVLSVLVLQGNQLCSISSCVQCVSNHI